jgi:hypothetical protein
VDAARDPGLVHDDGSSHRLCSLRRALHADESMRDGKVLRRKDGQPARKPGRKKTGKRRGGPHRVRPELDRGGGGSSSPKPKKISERW